MRIVSILSATGLLISAPFALAAQPCEHAATRDSTMDLSGIKTVVFDIGPHILSVDGGHTNTGTIRGKACASDPKHLEALVVTQQRDGDRLVVRAEQNRSTPGGSWSGGMYQYLTLTASIPDSLAVRVRLGSGDATVDGVASLSADVGSGDLDAHHVRGTLYVDVGSGDIRARDIGGLHVISVGSGDVSVRDVRGDAQIGSIGSGDAVLSAIAGTVHVKRIGSGDLETNGVGGDLIVDRVGSGSIRHRDVLGQLRIPEDD